MAYTSTKYYLLKALKVNIGNFLSYLLQTYKINSISLSQQIGCLK